MQDYRLALQNIYATAVSKIAAMKQNAKVLELLKHIKVNSSTLALLPNPHLKSQGYHK